VSEVESVDLVADDRVDLGADVDPTAQHPRQLASEGEQVEPAAGRVEVHEQFDVAGRRGVAAGHRAEDQDTRDPSASRQPAPSPAG